MSAEFATKFFPDASNIVQTFAPDIWAAVFPPELQQRCPPHQLDLQRWMQALAHDDSIQPSSGAQCGFARLSTYTLSQHPIRIRWPTLLPMILMGLVIGVVGWRQISFLPAARSQAAPPLAHSWWGLSFLFFALMNASAVACHCLMTPDFEDSWYRFAVAVDVGCTGAACWAAICAALHDAGLLALLGSRHPQASHQPAASAPTAKMPPSSAPAPAPGPWKLLGSCLAILAASVAGHSARIPFTGEALYILPALASVVPVAWYLLHASTLVPQASAPAGAAAATEAAKAAKAATAAVSVAATATAAVDAAAPATHGRANGDRPSHGGATNGDAAGLAKTSTPPPAKAASTPAAAKAASTSAAAKAAQQGMAVGSYVAVAGLMVVGAALPLDAQLCRCHIFPLLTHAHVLFLGCDAIYLGLLLHLAARALL